MPSSRTNTRAEEELRARSRELAMRCSELHKVQDVIADFPGPVIAAPAPRTPATELRNRSLAAFER